MATHGAKEAPLDVQYFSELTVLSSKYPRGEVVEGFLKVYGKARNQIDPAVLLLIDEIVQTYELCDHGKVEQWFTSLHAGMITEENKRGAILKNESSDWECTRCWYLACQQKELQTSARAKAGKSLTD